MTLAHAILLIFAGVAGVIGWLWWASGHAPMDPHDIAYIRLHVLAIGEKSVTVRPGFTDQDHVPCRGSLDVYGPTKMDVGDMYNIYGDNLTLKFADGRPSRPVAIRFTLLRIDASLCAKFNIDYMDPKTREIIPSAPTPRWVIADDSISIFVGEGPIPAKAWSHYGTA